MLGSALLERVVRAELPLALPVPGEPAIAVQVVDIRYCGPDAGGRARARAVITPGAPAAGSQAVAALRAPDDCAAPLEALAQRVLPLLVGGKPPAVAVAELGAAASSSDLVLSLERVVLAGERALPGAQGLHALAGRRELRPVPISGVQVGDPGAKPAAVFHLGFEWRPDGVVLTATPGPRPLSGPAGGRDRSAASDLSIDLPLGFINALVQDVLARGPIRVPVDPEEVALSDVRVAQADGRLLVTGRATPRSVGQSFDVVVDLAGADLQVADVQVTAPGEDCAAMGVLQRLGCDTRNAGRAGAAQALAAGLRQRYRGQLVRTLVGPQEMKFDVAGRPLIVRAELQRLATHESTVEADATAATAP
jgi:hypothetical protein